MPERITWNLKKLIAFYELNGRMPFPIAGGEEAGAGEGKEEGEGKEDVAGLKSALQSEREARKAAEKSSKDLEKRLATIESSGKSDSEKLTARLEALEKDNETKTKSVREHDARDEVLDAVGDKANWKAVWKAIKADVEYNDAGKPTNLHELITGMKKDAPELFRVAAGKADAGAGNGGKATGGGMNEWIRQAAGRG